MKVFIDAGHNYSGYDTGAVGNGLREQDITFAVAYKTAQLLRALGVEVKLSRETLTTNLGTNSKISINARWQMANQWGADVLISLHVNAGTGAETLYYGSPSLAQIINDAYVSMTGLYNRGIKYRNNLAVIKYSNMPSALLEMAFIDTESDAAFIKANQDMMAKAVAVGICKYIGVEFKVEPEESEEKEMKFTKMSEIPGWAKPAIQKGIDNRYIALNEKGEFSLYESNVQVAVWMYTAGLWDKAAVR